jgi:uncharacterized phiE125 gp8 family phage protein
VNLTEITPAAANAATGILPLSRVKQHLRVSHSVEDEILTEYIAAALAYIEGREGVTRRTIAPRRYRAAFPGGTDGKVYLPLPPTTAIVAVECVLEDNTVRALQPSEYRADLGEVFASVSPLVGAKWPAMRATDDALRVTFDAGYAVAPVAARHAMQLLVDHWYHNRGAAVKDNRVQSYSREIDFGVKNLLAGLTVPPLYGPPQ